MHVRLAPPAAPRRLTPPRPARPDRFLILVLALLAGAGACARPGPAGDVHVEGTLSPNPPAVGPATLTLRVTDAGGQPVARATLRVEGHMSHPGMAPVLADAVEKERGVYEAAIEFTMAGDWVILVTGTLPDGGALRHRIDVANVRRAAGGP